MQVSQDERKRIEGRIATFICAADLLSKIPRMATQQAEFLIARLTNIVCEELERVANGLESASTRGESDAISATLRLAARNVANGEYQR